MRRTGRRMYISGLTPDAWRRADAAPRTTTAAGSSAGPAPAVIDQRRTVASLPFYGTSAPFVPVVVAPVTSGGAALVAPSPPSPVLPAPVPLPPCPPVAGLLVMVPPASAVLVPAPPSPPVPPVIPSPPAPPVA